METIEIHKQQNLANSCLIGIPFSNNKTSVYNDNEDNIDHKKSWWLTQLFESYDNFKDIDNSNDIIQNFSCACAKGVISNITKYKHLFTSSDSNHDIAIKLNALLKEKIYEINNGELFCIYKHHSCPVNGNDSLNSQSLCNCTLGWQKALLETLLDRDIKVNLLGSQKKGDKYCKIKIEIF